MKLFHTLCTHCIFHIDNKQLHATIFVFSELNRLPRSASPDHFKKHGGNPLFNEILGGHGGHGVYEGNYGGHGGYPIGGYNIGYGGHPGGYSGQAQAQAQAGAIAGGHGGASAISQAQSQSASFGFGPFSATITELVFTKCYIP
ncbi:uncharacterized protein [Euwallacea similis]|uniref:uncharacterized protein isoform X1 n=1 Tax=Euwallacea similis TaxID=1736056 RepID=UPI00344BDBB5